MSFILALLLALHAGAERLPLADRTVRVPAGSWRAVGFAMTRFPAAIECSFSVVRGASHVRVVLMSREELSRVEKGLSHSALMATGYQQAGQFRYHPSAMGDYAVVVDNQMDGRAPAEVRVTVAQVVEPAPVPVAELSARRRLGVTVVTLVLFSWLVAFATVRLRRALRARP